VSLKLILHFTIQFRLDRSENRHLLRQISKNLIQPRNGTNSSLTTNDHVVFMVL